MDPYEEQEKKTRENRLIMERFKEAWKPPIKILIIDLSLVSYVDTVAVKTLTSVSTTLSSGIYRGSGGGERGVRVVRVVNFTSKVINHTNRNASRTTC